MNATGLEAPEARLWRLAMADLTNASTHDYLGNALNLKIETPSDE